MIFAKFATTIITDPKVLAAGQSNAKQLPLDSPGH